MAPAPGTRRSLAPREPWAAEVLDACRRGERPALERVLRAEMPAVERLLGRLLGRADELEDLLQTTLLEAIRAFPRFRAEASVGTWMSAIAVRVTLRHFRRGRTPTARRGLQLLELGTPEADGSPAADRVAAARRALEAVGRHLEGLGAAQRIAFTLHALEGRSIDEVASLMGASRAATKARIFVARRRLRWRARRDPVLREILGCGEEY